MTALAFCIAYRDHDKAQQSEHIAYLVHLSAALVVFHSVLELDILLDILHCRAKKQNKTKKKSLLCLEDTSDILVLKNFNVSQMLLYISKAS